MAADPTPPARVRAPARTPRFGLPRSPYTPAALALGAAVGGQALGVTRLLTLPVVSLTLARLLLVLAAVALVVALVRQGLGALSLAGTGRALIAGTALLGTAIAASAMLHGCACAPAIASAAAYAELGAVAVLTLALVRLEPGLRLLLLGAAAAGGLVAAALALAHAEAILPAAADASTTGGRLAGTYGNANFLAYAAAFAVPPLLVLALRGSTARRVVVVGALAVVGAAILLTYSRSGALAAGAGAVAALTAAAPTRRRALLVLAGAAMLAVAGGGLLYPAFRGERERVSFPAPDPSLRSRFLSGWDGSAQGLIPAGPASLANSARTSVVEVTAGQGEGLSVPIGFAPRGRRQAVSLEARALGGPTPLFAALEDNLLGNGPSVREARITRRWKRLRVIARPQEDWPDGRLYVWQSAAPRARFAVRRVLMRPEGARSPLPAIDTRLGPSKYSVEARRVELEEARYLRSRRDAATLAAGAFLDHPLAGIGWESFPGYAERRLPYGALATHNEYLRVAAELGVGGLALLVLIAGAALVGVRRTPPGLSRAAAIGIMTTGAVGFVFINGLSASTASAPLAVAVGLMCASEPRPGRAETAKPTS